MTNYLNYLVEANLCMLLFALMYFLILKNGQSFLFARKYMLASLAFSIIVPLIQFKAANTAIPAIHQALPETYLPELMVLNGAAEINQGIDYWLWIKALYLAISAFFLVKLTFQVYKIYSLRKLASATTILDNRFTLYTGEDIPATFSFFNMVFVSNSSFSSKEEQENVITHELIHAKSGHSYDILLCEFAKALFWFNPILWYYKSSLIEVHEYEADLKSIQKIDIQSYSSQLARVALLSADLKLANHFNNSLIIKRLKMMKKGNKKLQMWKHALIWCLVPGLFFAVSCQEQTMKEIQDMADDSTMALELPENVQQRYDQMKLENPDSEIIALRIDKDEDGKFDKNRIQELSEKYGGTPKAVEVFKEENDPSVGYIILQFNQALSEMSKDGETFIIVEEMATPKEGMEVLYRHIAKDLQYPKKAAANNVEGKVFVEFVVEKDGSLSNVNVKRGLGYGCDEEAIRAVIAGGNWNPAKQRGKIVRQRLIIPITFALASSKQDSHGVIEAVNDKKMTFDYEVKEESDYYIVYGNATDGIKPLPGINIVVNNTHIGTVSNLEGKFLLKVPKENKLITASFVGFENYQIKL